MAYVILFFALVLLQFQASHSLPAQLSNPSSSHPCLQNPPKLIPNYGQGTVQDFGGLKSYVTGNSRARRAIILISDIYGYEAPKLRKIADKVADAGFFVLVPDFFFGDPAIANDTKFDKNAWLKIHSPEKGFEDAKPVISALHSRGKSFIGVAGFCWGGIVAVKLASSTSIKAAVALHPSKLTDDDINAVKVSIALLGAERDGISSPEVLKRFGEILSTKSEEFDTFVKIYYGVRHGFAVRYDENDEFAVKIAEEAQSDMLNWFIKHVK